MEDKMAQSKVNDYFVARKNAKGGQQSKRRRIELTENDEDISVIKRNTRSSNRTATVNSIETEIASKLIPEVQETVSIKCKQKPRLAATKRKGRSAKTAPISDDQQLITTAFSPKNSPVIPELIPTTATTTELLNSSLITITQNVEESTPKKQILESSQSQPRCRKDKNITDVTATPEIVIKQDLKKKSKNIGSVRKQLHLPIDEKNDSESKMAESAVNGISGTKNDSSSLQLKSSLLNGKESQDSNSLEQKLQPENLRKQLKKCGKLEELKAQLLQMNKAIQKVKKAPKLKKFAEVRIPSPVKGVTPTSESKSDEELKPAYEKYHSLASTPSPALSLPLKFRKIAETFRSMDTVVSMMHNRFEICTFSKLKNAVQVMTKKNFELNHVGQVKAVDPTAYKFKQETGLPLIGSKSSDYQLTIEADLKQLDKTKCDRVHFSATHVLNRRNNFHNELIGRVKYHHKVFLKNLDKPLNIPDDKITRWHPAFNLDNVPDVEEGDLPQPPVIQKYHTAKDVLNMRKGKLTAKVEEALAKISAESEEKESSNKKADKIPVVVPNNSAYRGIPASLLEKIRAKEAKKLEFTMTRDPEEDKKTVMMERLPDMMRIIRTIFVTEKKPALLHELVVKKLGDSTKSNISMSDITNHLKLLLELLPEWISTVEIKKGKYVKINRNIDIHVLSTKINEMIKVRK